MTRGGQFSGTGRLKLMMLLLGLVLFALCKPAEGQPPVNTPRTVPCAWGCPARLAGPPVWCGAAHK